MTIKIFLIIYGIVVLACVLEAYFCTKYEDEL